MAKYSDGVTEAMIGDVVRCGIPNCAWCDQKNQYRVTEVYERDVQLRNELSRHSSDLFELVSRAPSPEPEQPKVNGVYASGENIRIGDNVRYVKQICGGELTIGHAYTVEHSLGATIQLVGRHENEFWYPLAFELISRKEQPAVNTKQSPPLVVWPEEKPTLTWNDLPDQSLFVWVKCPDMPCLRDGSRWFVVANHEKVNKLLFCGSDEVRIIQFNPANKEPVFVVI